MDHLDGLPRPDVDIAWAERVAASLFGVAGAARELGSQQDRNFLIDERATPGRRFVLKVNNPVFVRAEIDAQNAVMATLASAGLTVPEPQPSLDGCLVSSVEIGGVAHDVRLLSFVPGEPLIDCEHLSDRAAAQLGDLAGRVSTALGEIEHPGLDRWLQWDLRHAQQVVAELIRFVADPERRALVEEAVAQASARLERVAADLPVQAVHADLTDDNVVVFRDDAGSPVIGGVIDFGDSSLGWRVAELAVACSPVFHHSPSRPLAVLPVIAAFDAIQPLTDAEIDALWPLMVLRGAVLVVSGAQQVAIDPGNDYASSADEREWRMLAVPAGFDADVATAAIRRRLGRPTPARSDLDAGGGIGRMIDVTSGTIVDLGYSSRELRAGAWLDDPEGEEDRVLTEAAAESSMATTRFAEARLTRSAVNDREAPRNVALALDVALPPGSRLIAPFDGGGTAVRRLGAADCQRQAHRPPACSSPASSTPRSAS